MQLDSVGLPGEAIRLLPTQRRPPLNGPKKRSAPPASSPCSPSASASPPPRANGQNTIVVLPFINFGVRPATLAPLYGYALADAIAARLARMPPSSSAPLARS